MSVSTSWHCPISSVYTHTRLLKFFFTYFLKHKNPLTTAEFSNSFNFGTSSGKFFLLCFCQKTLNVLSEISVINFLSTQFALDSIRLLPQLERNYDRFDDWREAWKKLFLNTQLVSYLITKHTLKQSSQLCMHVLTADVSNDQNVIIIVAFASWRTLKIISQSLIERECVTHTWRRAPILKRSKTHAQSFHQHHRLLTANV